MRHRIHLHPTIDVYQTVSGPFTAERINGGRKWGIYGHRPNVSATVRVPKTNGVFKTKREALACIEDLDLNKGL